MASNHNSVSIVFCASVYILNRKREDVLPLFVDDCCCFNILPCIFIFLHTTLQFLLKDRKGNTLVEEYDKYENTPLHVAAKKGYVKIVHVSRS